MAAWALVIAILGLAVAFGSAFYTRQMSKTDRDRRHDERTPRFDLAFKWEREPQVTQRTPIAIIDYRDGPDLDSASLELVAAEPNRPEIVVGIGAEERPDSRSFDLGPPVRAGERRTVVLCLAEGRPKGSVASRLNCGRGGDTWAVRWRPLTWWALK